MSTEETSGTVHKKTSSETIPDRATDDSSINSLKDSSILLEFNTYDRSRTDAYSNIRKIDHQECNYNTLFPMDSTEERNTVMQDEDKSHLNDSYEELFPVKDKTPSDLVVTVVLPDESNTPSSVSKEDAASLFPEKQLGSPHVLFPQTEGSKKPSNKSPDINSNSFSNGDSETFNDLFPQVESSVRKETKPCSVHDINSKSSPGYTKDNTMPLTKNSTLFPDANFDDSGRNYDRMKSGYLENALFPKDEANRGYSRRDLYGDQYSRTPNAEYKQSGNAIDVIVIRGSDGVIRSTPWHVSFSWSRFKSTGSGDNVQVYVNGHKLRTDMLLHDRGRCYFPGSQLTPPLDDLNFIPLHEVSCKDPSIELEHNILRFEHRQKYGYTRYVEARIYVWESNDSIVVADLDGTITINDVEGHIRTLRLGQYDFIHSGACEFFMKLHEVGCRILYLTARPIDWATGSRNHLDNAEQGGIRLPKGPLITNSGGLRTALVAEVVNKNPHVFKTDVLNMVQLEMIHAGRTSSFPVFVCGFGNRPTDVIAYSNVGMDADLIFLIDPSSSLKASSNRTLYESYRDPLALMWLLPRLKHKMPLDFVEKIDLYTAREVVLADEIEQIRIAEQRARRMKEEEERRIQERAIQHSTSMSLSSSGATAGAAYSASRMR